MEEARATLKAFTHIHLLGEYVNLFGTPIDRSKLEAYLEQPEYLVPVPPPNDSDAPSAYPPGTGELTEPMDSETIAADEMLDVL